MEVDYKTISRNPQWLNLYRYTGIGLDNDSTVTNQSWFFHSEGRQNPELELKAAIEKLSQDSESRCRYPARTLFLKRLGLLKTGSDSCPKFEYFARKLQLENIWIVFASYYVNNPSSAFGHTLFKIQGKGNDQNDFLEYGANFAAQTTTNNPLAYSLLGLTGGFRGNFGLLPYFVKIQEYNDSETRDLWEYKLNLNDEEKAMFLAHLWEMDQAQFDYYYLTENCSYHLLSFLDAIRPRLNFKEKLPYFVLPSETLSILNKEVGFISEVRKRPSQFNIVQSRFSQLNPKAQDHWKANHSFIPATDFSPKEKADYLDFAIDYVDLKYRDQIHSEVQTKGGEFTTLKRDIQIARSQVNIPTSHLKTPLTQSPERIHPPRIVSMGYEMREYQALGDQQKDIQKNAILSYRFAFHEFLDNPDGAPTWSELIMGKIKARYEESNQKLYLDQFTLFKTHANQQEVLSPLALSWLVEIGARDHLFSYHHDFGPYIKSHIGYNWQNQAHLFRVLLPIELDYSSRLSFIKSPFKLLTTPRISYFSLLSSGFRMGVDLGVVWRSYLKNDWKGFSEVTFQYDLTNKMALAFMAWLQSDHYQGSTQIKYYF